MFLQKGLLGFGTWQFLLLKWRSLRLLGWGAGCIGEEILRGLLRKVRRNAFVEEDDAASSLTLPWCLCHLPGFAVCSTRPCMWRGAAREPLALGTEASGLCLCSYSCLPKHGINPSWFCEQVGPTRPCIAGAVWLVLCKVLWQMYFGCALSSCFVILAQYMTWLLLACNSERWLWPDKESFKKVLELPGV